MTDMKEVPCVIYENVPAQKWARFLLRFGIRTPWASDRPGRLFEGPVTSDRPGWYWISPNFDDPFGVIKRGETNLTMHATYTPPA